jgi:predicted RND superfamily exporter protein
LPYLGVLVYLIVRGHKIGEHTLQEASRQDAQMREYVQSVTAKSSPADELRQLHELQTQGAITPEEYEQAKAKILA